VTCVSRLCSNLSLNLLIWATDSGLRLSYRHYTRTCEQAVRCGKLELVEWLLGADNCISLMAITARDKAVQNDKLSPPLLHAFQEAVQTGTVLCAIGLLEKHGVSSVTGQRPCYTGNMMKPGYYDETICELDRLFEFRSSLSQASDVLCQKFGKASDDAERQMCTDMVIYLRRHGIKGRWGDIETQSAAKEGRLDDLKRLYASGHAITSYAYDAAVSNKCIEVMLWTREVEVDVNQWACSQEMRAAVQKGDLQQVKQLYESGHAVTRTCWSAAASGGHVHVCEWLQSIGSIDAATNSTGREAVRGGHIELVSWLHKYQGLLLNPLMMSIAAERGDLKMLIWLREHDCEWGIMFEAASALGRLDILRWLLAEGCPWYPRYSGLAAAARHGHIDVVR
jgi:hypothetical protein